jgi:RNA polymerase sigma-70 factor (ECF subfamily)
LSKTVRHKSSASGVVPVMNAPSEAVVGVSFNNATATVAPSADIESIFQAQYTRIARVIARIISDPSRAEELAVEVFLKWSRHPDAQGAHAEGWLYRTAARIGLDELRRQTRRAKYERLFGFVTRRTPTPEDVRAVKEEQANVRTVLNVVTPRQAQLLVLRSEGLSYDELASALGLNPASIGTLLARAQQAFRKEYVKRYGEQ